MKYEITKEQILEAHKSACDSWKKKIESWYPDVFKNTLEVGKWYKSEKGSIVNFQGGKLGYGYSQTDNKYYNVEDDCNWTFITNPENWQPATDTEVSEMLFREAERRGYKRGNFECLYWKQKSKGWHTKIYNTDENRLWLEAGACFDSGKWAEIIVEQPTEMTHDEIEKALGKKIKIVTK